MHDKVFIDSNILIYAYSVDEPDKQNIVRKLFYNHHTVIISTQTVNEFVNVTTRKKMLTNKTASLIVSELFKVFLVQAIDQKIIQKAILLAEKHRYSYFDCLMLASALSSGCSVLYSEDMHHSHAVEGSLKIIIPFADAA